MHAHFLYLHIQLAHSLTRAKKPNRTELKTPTLYTYMDDDDDDDHCALESFLSGVCTFPKGEIFLEKWEKLANACISLSFSNFALLGF